MDERITKELHIEEQVVWAGKPLLSHLYRKRDMLSVPISILMLVAGFSFLQQALTNGREPASIVALCLFILVALYNSIGRALHKIYCRKKYVYALTNQRILILYGDEVISLDYKNLGIFRLKKFEDGVGSILFEKEEGGLSSGASYVEILDNPFHGFRNIANVEEVYTKIQNIAFTGNREWKKKEVRASNSCFDDF